MRLSVIIVNWNTRDYLLGALRSLQDQPSGIDIETIVVDNASSDGSAEAVAEAFPHVRLIANPTNEGYARGNNIGIRAATGDQVLLLNPDVVVPPDALQVASEVLAARPDVAALGARLIGPDGAVQASVRGFPTPWSVLMEAVGIARLFPRNRLLGAYRMAWFTYDCETEVDQPMGTFLLLARTALDKVGLLDERFPVFFNEVDWCYRARRAGWKILFTPRVDIVHYGGGSTHLVWANMAWESRNSLLAFYRKHYPSPFFAPVYWLAAATSGMRAWLVARRRARQSLSSETQDGNR